MVYIMCTLLINTAKTVDHGKPSTMFELTVHLEKNQERLLCCFEVKQYFTSKNERKRPTPLFQLLLHFIS